MPDIAYPLRDMFRPARPSPRGWIVLPLCLSLVLHVALFASLDALDWLRAWEPERRRDRLFTLETGTISPEELQTIAMVPDLRWEDVHAVRETPALRPEQLPDYRDAGPPSDQIEQRAAPRYEEDELPLVSQTALSDRSRAFVRDGELDAVHPGKERITYIPSRRPVGPMPTFRMRVSPRLGTGPSDLVAAMSGREAPFREAGTAPKPRLERPAVQPVPPPLMVTALEHGVEAFFAENGRPLRIKPLPLDVKIDVYAEPGSKFRYFRLTIQERRDGERLPVMAKNVLFVIDISASIQKDVLRSVRSAVANALAGFNRGDRFNVVRFSEQSYKTFDDFVPATPSNIAKAAAAVRREPGQVRTDVYTALRKVIADIPVGEKDRHRPTNIFLVTDGNATTGVQDIRHIVNDLSAVTRTHYSIFAINPGAQTANAYLLDLLAYRNRGVFIQAASPDATDAALLRLLMRYRNPVLMNLRAQYGNFEVDQVYPETLPNLYSGRPIVIYGRCLPGDNIAVQIIGDGAGDRRKFLFTSTLPEVLCGDKTIAREWARGKIHYLSSRIAREGEKKKYLDEIRRLGRKYGLAVPYQ